MRNAKRGTASLHYVALTRKELNAERGVRNYLAPLSYANKEMNLTRNAERGVRNDLIPLTLHSQ